MMQGQETGEVRACSGRAEAMRSFVWLKFRMLIALVLVVCSWTMALLRPEAYAFPAWDYLLFNGVAVLMAAPSLLRCVKALFQSAQSTVDVLVWLLAAAALGTGHWLEAAVILLISLLADYLASEADHRARSVSLRGLFGARQVTVLEQEDSYREIPLRELQRHQVVVVRPGQTIPVDGVVVSGKAEVHEAALTGESMYKTRVPGHRVLAGGITESGTLHVRAERVGGDTLLAHVDRLVNHALSRASRRETLIDRFARWYVGVVLVVGAAVFAVYGQFQHAVSEMSSIEALRRALVVMLAISPVALILAGPLALYAGLLRAAKKGLLIKGMDVLEMLSRLKILLLDKTGTLTYARPQVTALKTFGSYAGEEVLKAALLVEQHSGHPLAKAICDYIASHGLKVSAPDKFHEFEGGGACATQGDLYFKVGALWLMEDGRSIDPEVHDWLKETEQQGYTAVLVADREHILGGFSLEDEIREDAKAVLRDLREAGIQRMVMVTGDHAEIAERVREAVGVDAVEAECMPDKKMLRLQAEKRRGVPVGMVGDGINDAPALAAADVGIAMGALGSDTAMEVADVALLTNDFSGLSEAMRISRQTLQAERVGLGLALVANVGLLLLALMGQITLLSGSALQLGMVALVGLNAVRLYARG